MSKTLSFSGAQRAAIGRFGRDITLSAAAGSGKTTVLVERYLEAVTTHHARPENILAVTFTDKAAQVLKERIRRRAAETGLVDLRERLEGAWIGTIHHFCTRFLKENPLECGVDPEFAVLGAGEAELLMQRTLDVLFEESAEREAFIRILSDTREEELRSWIMAFHEKRCSEVSPADVLRSRPDLAAHRAAGQALGALLSRQIEPRSTDAEIKLSDACGLALEALKTDPSWTRHEAVLAPLRTLDRRSKTKERVAQVKECAEIWAAREIEVLAEPLKREWARLAERFSQLYEAEKRRLGVMDYEDLLVSVYRTLASKDPVRVALKERTRKRFSHIFVDEYQDTSLLQAAIFEELKQKDNLFLVGDVRQSIYRFRHAHPEIFLEAVRRSESLSLNDNYRSREEILGLVNGVFGRLFKEAYEPLVARQSYSLPKPHCLEWISIPRGEGSLDAHRILEARTIARRIREMVDSGFLVEEEGRSRPARWKDFAVLFHRTTRSLYYEKAMEDLGIPVYANKGRGFYDKIEVQDLMNLLRLIESAADDIATAAILRSPLAQVSDDALYWVARHGSGDKDVSFYEKLKRVESVPEVSAEDRARITQIVRRAERWRTLKDRLSVSELLHEIIEETDYEARILTLPGAAQARANVWKLIEMAAGSEERGIRGVSDFIRYIRAVSESAEVEAEARIVGEEEDVVRILTVHAAKGLEFPIVVLADLGGGPAKGASRPMFMADASKGLGARVRDPITLDFCEDAVYRAILDEEAIQDEKEEDRLLYVAMTRAREHLILSGVADKERKKASDTLSRMAMLEAAILQGGFAFHRIAPMSAPPARTDRIPKLADELPRAVEGPLSKEIEKRLLPVEKPYESWEDLSVTRLVAASQEARSKRTEDLTGEEDALDEEATPRNEFGTIFHLLMEVSARAASRGRLAKERIQRLCRALTPDERAEAAGAFEGFWAGELGARVQKAERCHPELPFIFKTKRGLIKGQMDLVIREAEGWSIIDYKTNRLRTTADRDRAAAEYAPQLGLYALAFWRLYGEVPDRTYLYFTSLGESVEHRWNAPMLESLERGLDDWYRKALDF